ncbi:MAG TPA: dethiobiotin synthase [Cytophagaceae bacterium]|jgi:dethiobiotin synthetase|nr:dethiobiotin synthase [Cytophagaceae bacterium]
MNYFVTAIGTDSGKTIVSAILTEALQADYWKPIQSGKENRDVETVARLINNGHSFCYEESYLFSNAISPHAAAKEEGVTIDLAKILLPQNGGNSIVIEGAGGVLVPLNENDFVIDIAVKFDAEIILVSNNYLGSINHTLLTIQELKRRNVTVKGIIFNGLSNPETENIILKKSGYRCLLRILPEKIINQEMVMHYAIKLFENWDE